MHAAKGLEWDAVFVVGLVDGVRPDHPVAVPAGGGRGGAAAALRRDHPRPRAADAVLVAGPQPRRQAGPAAQPVPHRPGTRLRTHRAAGAPPAKKPKVVLEGEAGELFERLRAWRSQAAQSASVPAYVVFTDATLQAIAETRPANLQELSGLPGIGARKLDLYGADVLATVGGLTAPVYAVKGGPGTRPTRPPERRRR